MAGINLSLFYISGQTHLINRVVYLIKSEALTESGTLDEESRKKYDAYARVEAIFSNFKTNCNNTNDFEEGAYLKKEGSHFFAAGKYSDYKIIIGSPEL